MRLGRLGFALAGLAMTVNLLPASAQSVNVPDAHAAIKQSSVAGYVAADSPPYRIEWTGTGGTFFRHAYAQEPAKNLPLTYLHSQVGPTGYSKHLAWFLARDKESFSILWLYLNDSGSDFGCWLYQYPANRLTYQKFQGNYRFTPPASTPAAYSVEGITLAGAPAYTGTDFTYRNWTRQGGSLSRIELMSPPPEGPTVGTSAPATPGVASRVLTDLKIAPLHQIQVGAANGWRSGGWRELHALATDSAGDPYYLILYSNETSGFAVDIKRAQTYTVNYGEKVHFDANAISVLPADHSEGQGELRVPRYEAHDFSVRSKQAHVNPYTEVNLTAEFEGPDGKKLFLPGYWEGGSSWNFRFAPSLVGDWKWTTRSNDSYLNEQAGSFECVAVDGKEHAFFNVHPDRYYRHHFATSEGKPILPFALRDPVSSTDNASVTPALASAEDASADAPSSFAAFEKRVDRCATLGVDRFTGGYLLGHDPAAFTRQANEGGTAFLGDSLDRPNPEFFRWMDRRIMACNVRGIVPDIGFGWPSSGMFEKYTDTQLRRFWLYILARYAAYDISWNLFGYDGTPLTVDTEKRMASFAELTHLYDPNHHPVTSALRGLDIPDIRTRTDAVQPTTDPAAPAVKRPTFASTPFPVYPARAWLDYLTLVGGSPNEIDYLWAQNRPVVVLTSTGLPGKEEQVSLEITRRAMWETRMRGGYWSGNLPSTLPSDSPAVRMEAACAKFFRQTRWWRIIPHPEILEGKVETPPERRRRLKAEAEAFKAAADAGLPAPKVATVEAPKPNGPRFLLADPGREYVVYLEQGGYVTLDLLEATGRIRFSWFNPRTGEFLEQPVIPGGGYTTFVAPDKEDWVLYLSRR